MPPHDQNFVVKVAGGGQSQVYKGPPAVASRLHILQCS